MANNALQAQLLKAGLVDKKKAQKITKQNKHAKRTGNDDSAQTKQAIAKAQAEKVAKDQQLNQERQQALEQKTVQANIVQMIKQHNLPDTAGEVIYQFIDDGKIKKLNINQKIYDQLVAAHVVIARMDNGEDKSYALLPHPLAERINEKMEGFIIAPSADIADTETDEEDPYADYAIPDDLMW